MTAWWNLKTNSVQYIRDWLEDFQQNFNKVAGNRNLQFTVEIWTNENIHPPYENKGKVKTSATNIFPILDMKICLSPEGEMWFRIFRKKGQKLRYVRKEITPTPGTLRRHVPRNFCDNLLVEADIFTILGV